MADRTKSRHVALLRGVNVGGNNPLLMKGLADLFIDDGCSDVQTYIQSGNVVFSAGNHRLKGLPERISNEILKRYKHRPAVILRTAEQVRETIENNPFPSGDAGGKALHVLFLANLPEARDVGKLEPERFLPDAFAVRNREVYLHVAKGIGRTKLTAKYFDSKLNTTSTARNWRTVLKIYELMTHA